MDAEAVYRQLLERAERDANVLGVVLSGSRVVPSFVTPHSDFDVYLVLGNPDPTWETSRGSGVDTVPVSLDDFRRHAMPGTGSEWNRPSFIHARVEVDRLDGEIASITARKGRLEPDEARAISSDALDGYMNSLYRSLKNLRDGRGLAGLLDAGESVGYLLTTLFALNGRVRPFNKWLVHDLHERPLPVSDLLSRVERIVAAGDALTQQATFRDVEALARAGGLSALVESWQPDVALMRGE